MAPFATRTATGRQSRSDGHVYTLNALEKQEQEWQEWRPGSRGRKWGAELSLGLACPAPSSGSGEALRPPGSAHVAHGPICQHRRASLRCAHRRPPGTGARPGGWIRAGVRCLEGRPYALAASRSPQAALRAKDCLAVLSEVYNLESKLADGRLKLHVGLRRPPNTKSCDRPL
jgi:hypothetical protein